MKKSVFVILMMLIIGSFTGCQKEKAPIASFTYWIEATDNGAVVHLTNTSTNAKKCWWVCKGYDSYYSMPTYDESFEWSPSFTLTTEGWYTITLHIYAKESTETTQEIYIESWMIGNGGGGGGQTTLPTARFSFTGNNQYAPATVSFTNQSLNATSYLWNFGDGATSSSTNPTHTYAAGGNYNVTLTAMNSNGNDQTTHTVTVRNTPATWTLTKFVLTAYPLTDGGDNWDWTDAGPDIYFKLYDANNTLIYTSSTKDDVTESSLPLTWNLSNATLSTLTGTCTIKIYDEDGALDPDDLMGNITFVPAEHCGYNNSTYSWTAGSWSGVWTFSWGY